MMESKFADSVNYWANKRTKGYGTWQWVRDTLKMRVLTREEWRETFFDGMATYIALTGGVQTEVTRIYSDEVRNMLNHCAEMAGLGQGVVK